MVRPTGPHDQKPDVDDLAAGSWRCGVRSGYRREGQLSPMGPPDTPGAVVPAAVSGTLSFPQNASGRVPAVVVAHDSAGLTPEPPESDSVASLNAAALAPALAVMWKPRPAPSRTRAIG